MIGGLITLFRLPPFIVTLGTSAVVSGGTSLFGGRGSIIGTLVRALIVGVCRSGFNLSGVDVLWQQFAVGALIIIAVAIDHWLRKVSS